jgi:hypothetical protein
MFQLTPGLFPHSSEHRKIPQESHQPIGLLHEHGGRRFSVWNKLSANDIGYLIVKPDLIFQADFSNQLITFNELSRCSFFCIKSSHTRISLHRRMNSENRASQHQSTVQ